MSIESNTNVLLVQFIKSTNQKIDLSRVQAIQGFSIIGVNTVMRNKGFEQTDKCYRIIDGYDSHSSE